MHLLISISYHLAGLLRCPNAGFLLPERGFCKTWHQRLPPQRYPESLERRRCFSICTSFRCPLPKAKAAARDLKRARISAKSSPEMATSAIWKTVRRAWHEDLYIQIYPYVYLQNISYRCIQSLAALPSCGHLLVSPYLADNPICLIWS